MHLIKNCYLCKHLAFFDVTNRCGYYCTISGKNYHCNDSQQHDCPNYYEEHEE